VFVQETVRTLNRLQRRLTFVEELITVYYEAAKVAIGVDEGVLGAVWCVA
jgi:hypothetical protein